MIYVNITVNGVEYTPVVDKWQDLKQAFAEGAIIEYRKEYPWDVTINPTWCIDYEYRIKDDISISSWNKHKDVIKQYWNGAKVEVKVYENNWLSLSSNPNWNTFEKYRIKQDKWKLPEYEWYASKGNPNLQASRRRATKELAERCAKASKQRDLLEAYRDHLEPDYVDPDWDDSSVNKYYIYLNKGKYAVAYNFNAKDLGKVYGSQKTMTQICNALNNKEITL